MNLLQDFIKNKIRAAFKGGVTQKYVVGEISDASGVKMFFFSTTPEARYHVELFAVVERAAESQGLLARVLGGGFVRLMYSTKVLNIGGASHAYDAEPDRQQTVDYLKSVVPPGFHVVRDYFEMGRWGSDRRG